MPFGLAQLGSASGVLRSTLVTAYEDLIRDAERAALGTALISSGLLDVL